MDENHFCSKRQLITKVFIITVFYCIHIHICLTFSNMFTVLAYQFLLQAARHRSHCSQSSQKLGRCPLSLNSPGPNQDT